MQKIPKLTFIVLAMFLSAASYANQLEPAAAPTTKNEARCDGISQADFSISHFDTDEDGSISLKEFLSAAASNTERSFKHMDANGDGRLDGQEQQEIAAVYKVIHEQHQAKKSSNSI